MGIFFSRPMDVRLPQDIATAVSLVKSNVITELVIHQGVAIGEQAFRDCTNLTSIYVMCGHEGEKAAWSVRDQQLAAGRTITFIQEHTIKEIIKMVIIQMPGHAYTLSVFPSNLLEVAGSPPSQVSMTTRPSLNIYDAPSRFIIAYSEKGNIK